jgi:hypothetical protein
MMKRILFALLVTASIPPLFAAGPYVPTDAERARWTMMDMNSWRTALAAYKLDHGAFPQAKTLEAARAAIEPMYIMHTPMHDAWGNPYRYDLDEHGQYRIISAGADGIFEPDSWSATGRTKDLKADAVGTNEGGWLQRSWDTW